ncbi:MAG: hypothetical protein JW915_04205 [Chitinispirillaceae bacterium]|nr:hypothetical protein [Chitinispirillaceae bacterium]
MKCFVIVLTLWQTIFSNNFDSLVNSNGIKVEIDAEKELQYNVSLPVYLRIKVKNIYPVHTFIDSEFVSKSPSEKSFIEKIWALGGGRIQNVDLLANYAPSVKVTIKKKSGEVVKDVFIEEDAYYSLVSRDPYDNIDRRLPEKEKKTKTPLHSGEWHTIHYDIGPYLQDVIPGEYSMRIVFIPQLYTPDEIWKQFQIKVTSLDTTQSSHLSLWLDPYNNYYNKLKKDYFQQTTKEAMLFRNDFDFKLQFLQKKITSEEVFKTKDNLSQNLFSTVAPFLYLNFAINESTLPIRSELVKYFPDILYPLALCLEYETELSLKNKVKAKTIKEQILTSYPEYKKKIEDVDSGNGIIQRLKKIITDK